MILQIYTAIHVLISLVAIVSGFLVVFGWISRRDSPGRTSLFLATTLATSVTGFFFPFKGFTPALGFGIVSVLLLAAAYYALVKKRLAGGWRKVFILTSLFALYLNTFVLIVQSFLKIPPLHALAPTQAEPPFAIAQGALLLLMIGLGFAAVRNFREPLSGSM